MIINSEFLHNALVFITIIFMAFGTYFLITVGNSKVDEKLADVNEIVVTLG